MTKAEHAASNKRYADIHRLRKLGFSSSGQVFTCQIDNTMQAYILPIVKKVLDAYQDTEIKVYPGFIDILNF